MVGVLDFAVLPPEVNSGLMYAGSGSGPLVAAAAAWADLAGELDAAAGACAGVLSGLTAGDWRGPAAVSMLAAAAPYASWMRTTAGHAARAAGQAAAAADAYEAAFAATVPPVVVSANRAQLAVLTAANVFGQNTAAIAATEASYAEMWARDAAAMYGYAGRSAAAASLAPLTEPPSTTTDSGSAQQAAATAQATAPGGQNPLSQLLAELQAALKALTTGPAGTWNTLDPAEVSALSGLDGLLNDLSGHTGSALGTLLNANLIDTAFSGGILNPESYVGIFHAFDYLLAFAAQDFVKSVTASAADDALSPMITQMSSVTPAPAGTAGPPAPPTAGVGKATLVGALSAPKSWATGTALAQAVAPAATAAHDAAGFPRPIIATGLPRPGTGLGASRRTEVRSGGPGHDLPTRSLAARTPAGG